MKHIQKSDFIAMCEKEIKVREIQMLFLDAAQEVLAENLPGRVTIATCRKIEQALPPELQISVRMIYVRPFRHIEATANGAILFCLYGIFAKKSDAVWYEADTDVLDRELFSKEMELSRHIVRQQIADNRKSIEIVDEVIERADAVKDAISELWHGVPDTFADYIGIERYTRVCAIDN